jgi:hypothetical protein
MILRLFTCWTQVCTFFGHFIWTTSKFDNAEHIEYPIPDLNVVGPSEEAPQLTRESSSGPLTQEQLYTPTSYSSDTYASHGASPVRKATPKELGRLTIPQSTRVRNSSPNGLPSQPPGVNGKPRLVPKEEDGGGGLAEYRAKFTVPSAPPEGVAQLDRERLVELEQQLSVTLVAKTERDQRLAQLTDELALKSALLKEAEANAAEAMKRAELVVELERQLSATLAAQTQRDRRLTLLIDELALKSALLEQAQANATEAKKRAGLELREHADRLLAQASLGEQKNAELVSMQAKLDEAQDALQKATARTADADERSQRECEQIGEYETELAEVRAKLEAKESELEAVRLRLTDAENGCAKSKTEASTSLTLTAAGLVSTDESRITHILMERMRAMEAEVASLRLSEKSSELIQSRNEG